VAGFGTNGVESSNSLITDFKLCLYDTFMHSLHDVHKMNAYRADHVGLSIRLSVNMI
jgi:hypothetical protein